MAKKRAAEKGSESKRDGEKISILKSFEKMNKKVLIYCAIAAAVIIIAGVLIYNTQQNAVVPIVEENFKYLGYEMTNEAILKENCIYIRVGRCDKLGGGFGKNCWFNPVLFKYQVQGIPIKNIVCNANEQGVDLKESTFEKQEDVYALTFNVDIRKQNKVSVCCQIQKEGESSNKVCFENVTTEGIC